MKKRIPTKRRFCRRFWLSGLPAAAVVCLWAVAHAGTDDASRYAGTNAPSGWISGGHRGDVEFGLWQLEFATNSGAVGNFIGNSGLGGADINTGGKAFGLYANPSTGSPSAGAIRKFAKPALTTGDTLSFRLAVNYRNGTKGFTLRNSAGTSQWNFSVGRVDNISDGYYIRNGVSGSAFDNGQRFGGYNSNTVFTFNFVQRESELQWSAVRSGGLSATVSGTLPVESGAIADLRFFVTGTDAGGLPQNNLYFNNLSLTTEARADTPLTIGERRTPGVVPSYFLRFSNPGALNTVSMRHDGDWNTSYSLAQSNGVWSIDIRSVLTASNNSAPLSAGWHEFKFRTNSVFEGGDNRLLYIDTLGRVTAPPAVYLTWQRDPTTTMTVHWHNFDAAQNTLRYRVPGAEAWNTLTAATTKAPFSERLVRTAEITGLNAGWIYEFQVDGYDETFRFRTIPADLTQPVKFAVAGDADVTADADSMARAIAAKDPAFVAMIGDHAYENSRADNFWKWERYFQSLYSNLRAPDGRLIPLVPGIGNHEVYNGWSEYHPDFENTADWRLRYAASYYRFFAFPGAAQPHGVLDFGNYLSLIILDTEHSSPTINGADSQTQWLAQRLNERRAVKHLLPMYHVPAYPSNRAFTDPLNARIRAQWLPLFENAGVHLAFEHHDHTYKRTKPILAGLENAPDGIVFAGDGAWGVATRTPDMNRTYLHNAQARNHAFLVTISNTGRTVEAVDKTGAVFDTFNQTIDGLASAPITPALANLVTNSASFTWAPVANATNYAILRNGIQIGTTTSTNFTDNAWTPASGATYQIVALNRSGTFTNASTAPAPRSIWNVTNNFPWNSTGEGASLADPDSDGIVNLGEYFHGLNPRVRDESAPFALHNFGGSNIAVRYRVNSGATDVSGGVEWTPSLAAQAWTNSNVTTNDLAGEWAGWRAATVPVTNGMPAGFLRLRIRE